MHSIPRIARVTDTPLRCSMKQPHFARPSDPREQPVSPEPPAVPIPPGLLCSDDSARYHRGRQREERVAVLEAMYRSGDVASFDRWFLKLHADDAYLWASLTDRGAIARVGFVLDRAKGKAR